jgi:hypothetical protein
MNESPKVAIIILNWNGWLDTIECLDSLLNINYNNFCVILVDNNSEDDSIQKIKEYCDGNLNYSVSIPSLHPNKILISEYDETEIKSKLKIINTTNYPSNLFLIKNDKNYGFAEGNNIGIEFVLINLNSDYILLLNNDTVVEKDFLNKLVDSVEGNDKIGVIGPKIYYYKYNQEKNIINFRGGEIKWHKYPGYHKIGDKTLDDNNSDIKECDWITGAALMFKTNLPIRYLDKQYFFGCEDVDFCLKLKDSSYKVYVNPQSYIWHKLGQSRHKKSGSIIKSGLADFLTNCRLLKNHNKHFIIILPIYTLQMFLGMIKILLINFLSKNPKEFYRNI